MTTRPLALFSLAPSDDFWERQSNAQKFSYDFAPFGIPTEVTANDPVALTAAQLSGRRFSRVVQPAGPAIRLQIIVRKGFSAPVPENLPEQLAYSGLGDWITLSAAQWGQAFGNLSNRQAVIVLAPTLAGESRLVSRYFIDHYILNFLFTEWAMLHAACVLDPEGRRLIIIVGNHNAGKSTTALRLTRAGYPFLADGMVLLKVRNGRLVVGGYPIGEVKLRDDGLQSFPEYSGARVRVREHTKTVVDLRAIQPNNLAEALVVPTVVQVCFVDRGPQASVEASALAPQEAFDLIPPNTVFWNYPAQLEHNTHILNQLLRNASFYRLRLGTDPDQIIAAFNNLQ